MYEEDQVPLAGEEAKISEPSLANIEFNPYERVIESNSWTRDYSDYFNKFDEIIEKAQNGNLEIEELSSLEKGLIGSSSGNISLNYDKFDQLVEIILSKAYPKDAESIADCNQHYIDLLLELDKKMLFGRNILNKAAFVGDVETVKILLSAGKVNVNTGSCFSSKVQYKNEFNFDFNHFFDEISPIKFNQESDSRYSLALAISRGHIDVVKILLAHDDIEVNIYDKSYPLQIACANQQLDIVQLLINRLDIKLPDNIGNMPFLLWACVYGHDEIVQTLIARGEDICVKYRYKRAWGISDFIYSDFLDQYYSIVSALCQGSLDVTSKADLLFNAIKRAINFGANLYLQSRESDLIMYSEPLKNFLQAHTSYLNEQADLICSSSLQNISFENLKAYQKYKADMQYLINEIIPAEASRLCKKLDNLIEVSSVDSLEGRFTTTGSLRASLKT